MCVTSAVMRQYNPWIPRPEDYWAKRLNPPNTLRKELRELRELIDSFKKAMEAAEVFDRLTGQPDCEDENLKQPLLDRVAEIEKRLAAAGL